MPEAESGAERLTEEVLADARRKADRRRRSAERDAARLLDQARAEAERDAERLLQDAQRRADRQAGVILATVDQEIHRRRLMRQAALLEDLIEKGADRAADRDTFDVRRVLLDLTVGAIEQMAAAAFRLEVSAADRDVVDEAFLEEVKQRVAGEDAEPPELTVDEAPAPIAGGVIVRAADGTQMVDNSFEARRRRLAPQLRQVLAEIAFPDHGETPVETKP